MMLLKRKINAFTLTEMIVVIIISAIVAGLAFSVLGIVQNQMNAITNNYNRKEQIQSFETALTIDFNQNTKVNWNPSQNKLIVSSPIKERNYIFYEDSIATDITTYSLRIKEKLFFWKGKRVTKGNIDAIKLRFKETREVHSVFVFKYNDPSANF
ncbi:prepilin-type N-terminal cleavage/methylation domain-containing protein [Aquimarina algicola]|uniref:Prepilin-type N-terminal cleavage/methylation domain-containing protein n=1 Tax=Aquimarina algicola TaxID=2589995 RepID=A0A504J9S0_9FLAO|nr:prepilin-type N-terminal cleavage/methylation domain-containing protein [Aquimarina algicola]TPN87676.1 prepilin-type N-terminal cleavage/methylation domain-containing protein [Aquimarina algicola]